MTSRLNDRWLWVGFGVFFALAAAGVRYAIRDVIRLTELDPGQYPPQDDLDKLSEKSISLDTLRTLTTSANPSIANAAITLVVSRFLRRPRAVEDLKRDADSSDPDTRRLSRQAIRFLQDFDEDALPGYLIDSPQQLDEPDEPAFASGLGPWSGAMDSRTSSMVSRLEDLEAELEQPHPPASAPFAGWEVVPSQRPPATHSPEEAARRRRRREAMVLHEGGGRVVERDIYRPVD